VVFSYVAILYCFWISFHRWNMLTPMRWVGLDNYISAFQSGEFHDSVRITFVYMLLAVPSCVILGLFVGLLLKQVTRGRAFFRLMFFLPVITSMVVAAMIWEWIFDAEMGLLNNILYALGAPRAPRSHWMDWLRDSQGGAMAAVLTVGVWKRVGYNAVIFLAGLNNIPVEYLEAARIDGAGPLRRFRLIILPLLSPTTFFIVVLQVIAAFRVLVSVAVMTGGGPAKSTNVLVYYLYTTAFRYFKMGEGSTLAIVVLLIILAFTVVQFRFGEKRVHYQ
jgi:multiple sugar transport system permease protein